MVVKDLHLNEPRILLKVCVQMKQKQSRPPHHCTKLPLLSAGSSESLASAPPEVQNKKDKSERPEGPPL